MPVRSLNPYEANIRARICAHLARPDTSYATLAAAVGVTPSAVGMWVCARSCPRLETLVALADHFAIPIHQLLYESLPMPTPSSKLPTITPPVVVSAKRSHKRNLSRLTLASSPASDVAQGRMSWPPLAPPLSPGSRPYSAAVQAVGGLVTRRGYDYK